MTNGLQKLTLAPRQQQEVLYEISAAKVARSFVLKRRIYIIFSGAVADKAPAMA